MLVNGKKVTPGTGMTYISQAATQKFWALDRILFAMSPYLTFEESDRIVDQMEKYASSKSEGNWTHGDCLQFLRDTLGNDRWNVVERCWEIDQQQAVMSVYHPEELIDTWVETFSMQEGTEEEYQANPHRYIRVKRPK